MPSLSDAIASVPQLGGERIAPPSSSPLPPVGTTNLEPGRNSVIRCPLPPLWQASPDNLRQFYLQGQVPQNRIMTPTAATTSAGGAVDNGSVLITNRPGGGGSSGGSTSILVQQAVLKTSLVIPNQQYIGQLAITESFQLLSISVSSPCRVQFYGSHIAQLQDASRALDYPPPAGVAQNIITDVALDTVPYTWYFQNRIGANADSPTQKPTVYVTITNLDRIADFVTLTVQYVPLEV